MQDTPIQQELTHLFRHSYGKMIAILINRFGAHQLENIEDAVQDALVKAMQIWPYRGMPTDPFAWLLRVSGNKLIDIFRRNSKTTLTGEDQASYESWEELAPPTSDTNIEDDQLRMIFACCHPSLSQESQIVLTLKLVAGFGNREIARALLKKEDAVAKSFTRAKRKLRSHNFSLQIPIEFGLRSRINIVLKILYLMFSEGYATQRGKDPIRKDFCFEAIRLTLLLTKNRYCNQPDVHALLALMCFHASRFEARLTDEGELIDLAHQNRNAWHHGLIDIGAEHLRQASSDDGPPSDYLLQAYVSYYHCTAPSIKETDWDQILRMYDLQLKRMYSPIVELNRVVAVGMAQGPKKGLDALTQYEDGAYSKKTGLYYAIRADLLQRLDRKAEAIEAYDHAIALIENEAEKRHLARKRDALSTVMPDR